MLSCLLACVHGAVLAFASPLPHDPGLSALTVTKCDDGKTVVLLAFSNADFAGSTSFDTNQDGTISTGELAAARLRLPDWIASNVTAAIRDVRYPCTGSFATIGKEQDVELTLEYDLQAGSAEEQTISLPFLGALPHGHRCYARVAWADETTATDALLHARSHKFVVPRSQAGRDATSDGLAGAFFVLGVEHILIGYDHLAFLLALLAVGVTLRRTLLTITAFSLAHSLTLTAAALDWLQLPGGLVEASIAGSIVFVALANLTQRHRAAPHRWPLAFAFGLLHGFGFAGVLAEFEVQNGAVLVPLLSFNLGVEAGQILCAAVAFPVLAALTRHRPIATSVTLSVLAGAMGLYWLLERTL